MQIRNKMLKNMVSDCGSMARSPTATANIPLSSIYPPSWHTTKQPTTFMQTVWRYEVIWCSMAISLDGTSIFFVNYLSINSLLRGNFFNLWADPDGLCFKGTLNELCITGRDWQASTCMRHWTGFQQKISDCDTHRETVMSSSAQHASLHHIYPVISCLMVWQCLKSHT